MYVSEVAKPDQIFSIMDVFVFLTIMEKYERHRPFWQIAIYTSDHLVAMSTL